MPSPLYACPVVSAPMGHLSCSREVFGEDYRLSVVYSPKQEDCSEIGLQVSSCLDGRFKRDDQFNQTSHSLDDYVVALEPLISCPVVKSALEGFNSRVIDVVEVVLIHCTLWKSRNPLLVLWIRRSLRQDIVL